MNQSADSNAQMTLDLTAARAARDSGMAKAIKHADAVVEQWSESAYSCLLQFIRDTRQFMTEDLRDYAHGKGLPKPPDSRAWGPIVMRAVKAGLIHRIGYAPMKSQHCHANPKSVWQKVGAA